MKANIVIRAETQKKNGDQNKTKQKHQWPKTERNGIGVRGRREDIRITTQK